MKNKKNFWFVLSIIIMAIIIISTIVVINVLSPKQKKQISYFAFFDIGAFKNTNDKWSVIPIDDTQVFSNKFDVLIDNEYMGKYELRYFDNKWYFFDNDMNSESFSGDLFAYHSNQKVSVANIVINELESSDLTYVNKVLEKEGYSLSSLNNLTISEKIEFDIDSDGEDEVIYSVSDADIMSNQKNAFSTVFYLKNNKVYTIKLDIYTSNNQIYSLYSINNLFKIGNSNKYYMCIYKFSEMNSENQEISIYKLNKSNHYELAISSNDKIDKSKEKGNSIIALVIILPILIIGAIVIIIYYNISKNNID